MCLGLTGMDPARGVVLGLESQPGSKRGIWSYHTDVFGCACGVVRTFETAWFQYGTKWML